MPKQTRYVYEFGPFRLDLEERRLLRGEQALALTPKAFETLLALVENCRHIVTKDELMNRVWPDIYVEETNLAQHVSMLRKTLGEREDGGQYIETVPKRGYRFTAPVKKIKHALTETHLQTITEAPLPLASGKPAKDTNDSDKRKKKTQILSEEKLAEEASVTIGPGARLGRYEILSELGTGGMGAVYLARDTALDRKVALKILSAKYTGNAEWVRRFVREAKAASALNHPNIITIYEIGQAAGLHFIAAEYIEGETLRRHLTKRKATASQPLLAALQTATQIASALAAAHAAGIVHRDIKPENVMIRPDGYVKVVDFGLAKQDDSQQPSAAREVELSRFDTAPGIVMGTVNYMSPEQARGVAVDARSDIFSLGVVLYEMVTGRAPFAGDTTSDVIAAILSRQPARLAQLLEDAPAELERILTKALRKERDERYQTSKDFQLDLKNLQQELELHEKFGDLQPSSSEAAAHAPEPDEIPEIHYARSGEINIAYQVVGDAPPETGRFDLVFVMGWVSHLEYFWSEPSFARFLRRLASFARVILFDKRGTGLSDRVPLDQLPTLEQRMDDVRAVMEAVGSRRAVLCGVSEGGPMCSLFAATYPEKTIALVQIGSYARRLRGPGYPWGPTEEEREEFFHQIREHWGTPVGLDERAPSKVHDPEFRNWWAAYLRRGASPGAALALTRMNTEIDIRDILPTIRVPTLVVHRAGDQCLQVEEGRFLAEQIPGAKFVELPGVDHLPFVGAQDEILDEIEEFLTGMRHAPEHDRVLATVLVVRADSELQTAQHAFIHKEVEHFKGRVCELTGEQLMAAFDGPARAIRAACAILDHARGAGLPLQAGLHTGECDVVDDCYTGLAVEIAQQVAAQANAGQALVSGTVKDLVAGSGIRFGALSAEVGEIKLFAVERGAAR